MRLKQTFDKNSPNLQSEIQSFMRDAVTQMKEKGMKMFFANQRNFDHETRVIVTGLDAVEKPMLASMKESGFAIIDTEAFGIESMQVDGFEAQNPAEISQSLSQHAKEEDLEVVYGETDDDAKPAIITEYGELLPFAFASPRAAYDFVSEVFDCELSKPEAEFLYDLGAKQVALNEDSRPQYQQIVGKIEPRYAEQLDDFVRDSMVSAQGRWLFYVQELQLIPQTFADADALHKALEQAGFNPERDDSQLVYKVLSSESRPPKERIADVLKSFEDILEKYLPDFASGNAPTELLGRLNLE